MPAILQQCCRACSRARCSSSTRSTARRARRRRCSISRWRISGSMSSWARAREQRQSRWRLPRSPSWVPRPEPACCPARFVIDSGSPHTWTSTIQRISRSSCSAQRAFSVSISGRPVLPRSPADVAGRPASPTACSAGFETGPRCTATASSTSRRRPQPSSSTRSMHSAWIESTAQSSTCLFGGSAAGRWACPRWPWLWARSPRPSRRWPSPFSSGSA